MKGETKRVKHSNGTASLAKREIGGNTYIVAVVPQDDTHVSHHVAVYGDKVHGDDKGFPSTVSRWNLKEKGYRYLAGSKVHKGKDLAPQIAKVVNEAVGELTGHLEDTKSQEDAVLGALEANAEVHEDED